MPKKKLAKNQKSAAAPQRKIKQKAKKSKIDKYLKQGLDFDEDFIDADELEIEVAGDGNCAYSAISVLLFGTP